MPDSVFLRPVTPADSSLRTVTILGCPGPLCPSTQVSREQSLTGVSLPLLVQTRWCTRAAAGLVCTVVYTGQGSRTTSVHLPGYHLPGTLPCPTHTTVTPPSHHCQAMSHRCQGSLGLPWAEYSCSWEAWATLGRVPPLPREAWTTLGRVPRLPRAGITRIPPPYYCSPSAGITSFLPYSS